MSIRDLVFLGLVLLAVKMVVKYDGTLRDRITNELNKIEEESNEK